MKVTLSDDELEARSSEALALIVHARALEQQAKQLINEALSIARSVLEQTDAPFLHDEENSVIIYPRHPNNIKAGINPITHARTEPTYKAAMERIQTAPNQYKYSVAIERWHKANDASQLRRLKAEATKTGRKVMRNRYGDLVLVPDPNAKYGI